ncbi:hypothetical protein ACHQM5_024185 [Ranunculus cassubicifolius]
MEGSTSASQIRVIEASAGDQRFLLNFISGNYLGADVIFDLTERTILQRRAACLPDYEAAAVGRSVVTLKELECLYFYILKDVPSCASLKEHHLQQYFNNKLYNPNGLEDTNQFHFFFPPEHHKQEKRGRNSKMFKGIMIITDPDVSYIQPDDLQRFMSLTGRTEVKISTEDFEEYSKQRKEEREEKKRKRRQESEKKGPSGKKARLTDPIEAVPLSQVPLSLRYPGFPDGTETVPSTMTLISTSEVESDNAELSVVYSGTFRDTKDGPPAGIVDVGASNTAYLFRVSLPGVTTSNNISCEVERCGRVTVEGFSHTGETDIFRGPHLFRMKTQNLPREGKFKVSFNLPGRVENRSFLCNISDGILEAIVGKEAANISGDKVDQ